MTLLPSAKRGKGRSGKAASSATPLADKEEGELSSDGECAEFSGTGPSYGSQGGSFVPPMYGGLPDFNKVTKSSFASANSTHFVSPSLHSSSSPAGNPR